jgi:hypothetical protein
LPFGTECGGKYCQYIGKFLIRWSGDIENYCNILPIFPPHSVPKGKGIFLLAIIILPLWALVPGYDQYIDQLLTISILVPSGNPKGNYCNNCNN